MVSAGLKERWMKFSNFLFPDAMSAADDGRVIDETLREARLTDSLNFDTIWLAEHHFDGIVAYVDPVAFAAALAVATTKCRIGFADRPSVQRPPDCRIGSRDGLQHL
jgi:alkanesulfonate monooxygenase SsuD/methylene tetrahydromethanopterin reductase-like flavin-dependent oxidoreductase (luciferase family)